MAADSFRSSMNALGWSRRPPDLPANTAARAPVLKTLQNLNPFGRGGYVRLPTHESPPGAPLPAPSRREEEEAWFARESRSPSARARPSVLTRLPVSRWDRILLFAALNLAALAMFVICFALMPVLSLKPRKFAIL